MELPTGQEGRESNRQMHTEAQRIPGVVHSEYLSITFMISAPYFSSLSSVTPSICSKTSASEDKVSATQQVVRSDQHLHVVTDTAAERSEGNWLCFYLGNKPLFFPGRFSVQKRAQELSLKRFKICSTITWIPGCDT